MPKRKSEVSVSGHTYSLIFHVHDGKFSIENLLIMNDDDTPLDGLYPCSNIRSRKGHYFYPPFWYRVSSITDTRVVFEILDADPMKCGRDNEGWQPDPIHFSGTSQTYNVALELTRYILMSLGYGRQTANGIDIFDEPTLKRTAPTPELPKRQRRTRAKRKVVKISR